MKKPGDYYILKRNEIASKIAAHKKSERKKIADEEKELMLMAKELSVLNGIDVELLMEYLVRKNNFANTCIL